jgi:tRNA A37 threonylcarbamoyltransferase TsaD
LNSIGKPGILGIETRGGAVIEREATTGREGKRQLPDPEKARAMLAAFSSVGVHSFDVTMTDIEGKKTGFQASRSNDEIAHAINRALDAATKLQ